MTTSPATQNFKSEKPPKKQSILKQFRFTLLVCYVLSLLISFIVITGWTRQEVYAAADQKLTLLVDMVKALRTYVAEDVRPVLLAKNVFHSPAVSSTVATKLVAEHFLAVQPDYYIKVFSDNPLNPENLPQPVEKQLLERFRKDRKLENLVEEGRIQGKTFLVSSKPSLSKAECLKCHGTFEAAPSEIQQQYGNKTGFGYKEDEVVGASVVGVPLGSVNQLVVTRSLMAAAVLTLFFSVIFAVINQLVQRLVLRPVVNITQVALDVSSGNLEREITTNKRDEIGELANAFELMRRSLLTVTNRLRKRGGSE
jgi:HAMP domain-containing protein